MALAPLALSYRNGIGHHADRSEIVDLVALVFTRGRNRVEVLHPDDEPSTTRAGDQHRREPGPQVADMEVTGRRGCESTGHRTILMGWDGEQRDDAPPVADPPPPVPLDRPSTDGRG